MSCASEAKIKKKTTRPTGRRKELMNEFCKYMQVVRLAVFSIADSVLAVLEQCQNKKSKKKKYTGTLKEKGPDLEETGQLLLSSPHEA